MILFLYNKHTQMVVKQQGEITENLQILASFQTGKIMLRCSFQTFELQRKSFTFGELLPPYVEL